MIYIILAACLIAIAAYYPIKLIKFYCMESKEQSLKNQIIRDLRAGRVNPSLINLILGEGGFRLVRSERDHIFEWMVINTDEWRVTSPSYDGRLVVVFHNSPFHPENWDDVETYKNVMRQMFGERRIKDFCAYRASMAEAFKIQRNSQALNVTEEPTRVRVFDYVQLILDDTRVLAMVVDVNDNNEKLLTILSGDARGQKHWFASAKAMEVIPNGVAISELVRQKEEWKNKKCEEAIAKRREEFHEKYGNILRGSYLKSGGALYVVESVDIDEAKATAIRLIDLGPNLPAGGKCILPLQNGLVLASPEEVVKILVKEYCNE